MGEILNPKKVKSVTPPPVPEPPPVPTVSDETEDFAAKDAKRRTSFAKNAFLTGNLTPKTTKSKKFGGDT